MHRFELGRIPQIVYFLFLDLPPSPARWSNFHAMIVNLFICFHVLLVHIDIFFIPFLAVLVCSFILFYSQQKRVEILNKSTALSYSSMFSCDLEVLLIKGIIIEKVLQNHEVGSFYV